MSEFINHNAILLFLSFAANKSTTSSRERLSDNFLSMDSIVRLLACCVDIVNLKYDLIHFSAEKDSSHSAELTIVSESCRSLTKLGNAALKGITATSMSLMVSSSCTLSAKVRLANTHSILSRSLTLLMALACPSQGIQRTKDCSFVLLSSGQHSYCQTIFYLR